MDSYKEKHFNAGTKNKFPECTLIFDCSDLIYASPATSSFLRLFPPFDGPEFTSALFEDDRILFLTALAVAGTGKKQRSLQVRYILTGDSVETLQCTIDPVNSMENSIVAVHFADQSAISHFKNEKAKLVQFFENTRHIAALLKNARGEELYALICSGLHKSGLFKSVWIGLVDEESSLLKLTAHQGLSDDEISDLENRVDAMYSLKV